MSCRAILPLALAAAMELAALPVQAEMVKAIDMEHHFAGVRVGMLIGRGLFHAAPLHPIPAGDQLIEEITAFLYGKE